MPKILLGSFIICPLVIHEHFDKRLLLAHFAITVTIYDFILGLQLEILIAISTYKHIKVAMGGGALYFWVAMFDDACGVRGIVENAVHEGIWAGS